MRVCYLPTITIYIEITHYIFSIQREEADLVVEAEAVESGHVAPCLNSTKESGHFL